MWTLNLKNGTNPKQDIVLSGGYSINDKLGGRGESYRLMVKNDGYIDIIDCSQPGELEYAYVIYFNGIRFRKVEGDNSDIIINLTINDDKTFCIDKAGNLLTGSLSSYPSIERSDIDSFNWMVDSKFIPYQKITDDPGKTVEQIRALGLLYFPFSEFSFQLAMSLYDWTTADFTRIDFFRIFVYTGVVGKPLDLNSIAQAIWTANWPPYTPQDIYYMNSFMMTPANSLEDVINQLNEKVECLQVNNWCEVNLIEASLKAMPRTSIIKTPKLYSGQVSIGNLGSEHFATYFEEFPYNSTVANPLEMPLSVALNTFIEKGKTLTLKSMMSFTDSLDDAMNYSNGIVLILSPREESICWDEAAYITPLSDGPNKTEYLFHPRTKFLIDSIDFKSIDSKNITIINLQVM